MVFGVGAKCSGSGRNVEPGGWCSAEDMGESGGKDATGLEKMDGIVMKLRVTAEKRVRGRPGAWF